MAKVHLAVKVEGATRGGSAGVNDLFSYVMAVGFISGFAVYFALSFAWLGRM